MSTKKKQIELHEEGGTTIADVISVETMAKLQDIATEEVVEEAINEVACSLVMDIEDDMDEVIDHPKSSWLYEMSKLSGKDIANKALSLFKKEKVDKKQLLKDRLADSLKCNERNRYGDSSTIDVESYAEALYKYKIYQYKADKYDKAMSGVKHDELKDRLKVIVDEQ